MTAVLNDSGRSGRKSRLSMVQVAQIIYLSLQTPTRTEKDFVQHIADVVGVLPQDGYIFIMDQLNTHQSEGLVRYIAKECGIEDDLGEKNKSGILKNMKSRQEFLENEEHRIRIVYTPKHCSWLNQVEMWFSILSRMLLNKRASFKSLEVLKSKIKEFIEYYNTNLAKPFKWRNLASTKFYYTTFNKSIIFTKNFL